MPIPMLYRQSDQGLAGGPSGVITIDATERAQRLPSPGASLATLRDDWAAISAWARALVGRLSAEQPSQHISVFIPEPERGELRLAAQVFGAGEDTGDVVAGEWLIPFEGSVCGRVYRTGLAALCADVTLDPDYRSFPGGRTRSSLTIPVGPPADVKAVVNLEAPWVSAFSILDYERLTEHASDALPAFPGGSES